MSVVGNLVVNLMGNSQQLQQTLNQSQSMLDSFKSRVMGTAAGVTAAFSIGKAVEAAQVQIAAEQKLAAVLKATGNAAGLSSRQITEYAASLQKTTGIGDETIIGAASFLASFKNIKGDVFKETLALSLDKSTITGQGLKETMVQLGKAVNDPIAGYSALAEVGVQFTEQQKRQIKVMQESGNILGAQKIILNEVAHKFGGAAAASSTPWKQFKATMTNVMEVIGYLVLPTFNKIVGGLGDLFDRIGTKSDGFKKVGVSIADGLGPLIDTFIDVVSVGRDMLQLMGDLPDTMKSVAKWVGILTGVTLVLATAYKAVSLAKAMYLALMGPAGVAVIAGAVVATGLLGAAMVELHDKYVEGEKDRNDAVDASVKVARAAKEEAKAIRDARIEIEKRNKTEAKRLADTVQNLGVGIAPGDDKRLSLIRDFERFNTHKVNRKLFPDLSDSVRKMDLSPSRNKDVMDAIENSLTGIVDAIKEAQTETKILNREMTEIDKTIQGFSSKKADVGKQDELRKILEMNKAIRREAEYENSLREKSRQIISDLRSPLEQLRDKFAEIQELQDIGFLDEIKSEQARAKAVNELMPGADMSSFGGVGAAQSGSQAAFGAIQAAIRSGTKDELQKSSLEVAKKQLAELEENNRLSRQRAEAPAGLPMNL